MIIVGYSGHAYSVLEASKLLRFKIIGYCDIQECKSNPFNLKYFGYEMDENFKGWSPNNNFILGIGDNQLRSKIGKTILSKECEVTNVIHPSASVSQLAIMGCGNFIARNAAINPMVVLGNFCIINTGAILEHECKLGDSVHVAPGAVIAGNVSIGDNTFIGARAVIIQGLRIGKNAVIGAGAVILKDVPDNSKIVGNPAREI